MTSSPAQNGLARELRLRDGVAIVASTMIGSGIFLVPSGIAAQVSSLAGVLAVWVVGAILSLAGVLALAELGSMFPVAGGLYVYLREAYGPGTAFMYGWASLVAIDAGAIAALGVAFRIYLAQLTSLPETQAKIAGSAAILVLAVINCLGVKFGKAVQNFFAVCKFGGIAGMCVLLFAHTNAAQLKASLWVSGGNHGWTSFGVAMIAALWSYFGWHESTYNAAEFANPRRDLPWALLLGSLAVSLTYVTANVAYYAVLSPYQIEHSSRVAATALASVMGPIAASVLAILIIISVFGGMNGMILSGPRMPYVMAQDGLFFAAASRTNARTKTPIVAIVLESMWAILLSLSGSFQQLITYCVFTISIFFGLAALAVVLLRRSRPDLARPFRTPLYPLLPILFAMANAALVVNTIAADPKGSLLGTAIVAVGAPIYFILRFRKSRTQVRAAAADA